MFQRAPVVDLHPRWTLILASGGVVLAAYVVLIETWRRMVIAWGETLAFTDAAAIWFVSNLVRYVPWGSVLQVGALAELARRRRVSPTTATGASIINVAVNITTGFVAALVCGFTAADPLGQGRGAWTLWIAVTLLAGLMLLPAILPRMLGGVQRLTGRTLVPGALPRRAMYISLAGNVAAWVMYGLAFELFVRGVLGRSAGTATEFIAVWAGAYVTGYLAVLLPAGLGAREAAVLAVSARLWLTALELIPALLYLARATRPRPHVTHP